MDDNELLIKNKEVAMIIQKESKIGHLTDIDTIIDFAEIELDDAEKIFAALTEENEFIELRLIQDDEGKNYYYSATDMTDKYANIMMGLNNNDFLKLIADSVRYESKVYPRPTYLKQFTSSPYNIEEIKLLEILDEINENSDYSDLKYTEASNGVRFIYSDRHMKPGYAKYLAEWIEVKQDEIP